MQKRGMVFDNYHTAAYGWTLTSWTLSEPEPKTHYIDKPSGDGAWDYTTALTTGVTRFKDRELTATFELSEGDRMSRERVIRNMINKLHGFRVQIELPDDVDHYMVGRLRVIKDYNDNAHAAITVKAICEPWKYNVTESWIQLDATEDEQMTLLVNNGRRDVVPTIEVDTKLLVMIRRGTETWALNAGVHVIPELQFGSGDHYITYFGDGTAKLVYREAVLE